MTSLPPPGSPHPMRGALATAMITLAGTPDHASEAERLMVTIARLAADRIEAASYASITALRGKDYITVAVSDELIRAVDEAQYADGTGPCIEAVDSGTAVGVPDIATMVEWPGFHYAAPRMGLRASVSVPLFAGRGNAIAALNVYGTDRDAMAPLIAAVWAVHSDLRDPLTDEASLSRLDAGGRDLVTGHVEALRVRSTVRMAIELIMAGNRCGADDAYLSLCIRAAEAGTDLAQAAAALIDGVV
jgi:hypothetical protein